MSLYRHVHTQLTPVQQQHYVQLARHLVIASQSPSWDPALFDMAYNAYDVTTGDEIPPEQVCAHQDALFCGPLGHAPRAGLDALTGETWLAYQTRILGVEKDSPLEDWLLSHWWIKSDNTPVGATMRLMYVLDYGVPGDWIDIIEGRARSDYMHNGFLWDRVGLSPSDRD